jgi:hypothetical protein
LLWARVFFAVLILQVFIFGLSNGQNRVPARQGNFASPNYLGVNIEYIGRFISRDGSISILRVNGKEERFRESDYITGTNIRIYRINNADIVVQKDGLLFSIPFSSSRNLRTAGDKKGDSVSQISPFTRCLNLNVQGGVCFE